MLKSVLIVASAIAATQAVDLTGENFEASIAGKGAFVKFFAPWCGHCKKMKPTWDQLAAEFEGNSGVVIADVDCTAEASKELCSKYGVRGYPTIKYFTSSTDPMGDKYEGGRDYDALKEFATTNLGPSCGPDNLDLCSEEEKAAIAKYQAMDPKEMQKIVDDSTKAAADAEADFKAAVEKLQAQYNTLMKEKDDAIEAANSVEGLKMMKIVLGSLKKVDAKDEL